jgi:hypothetical protein
MGSPSASEMSANISLFGSLGRWRSICALIAVTSLLAGSLVVFAGTSASRAADLDATPQLSFVDPEVPGGGNTGLNGPYDVAFDSEDNLWVVNNKEGDQNIVMFSKEQWKGQAGNQNVVPAKTIKINAGGAVQGLYGLDFDSAGNLWVSAESVGLLRLNKEQLDTPTTDPIIPDCRIDGGNTLLDAAQGGNPKQLAVHPTMDNWVWVVTPGQDKPTSGPTSDQMLAFTVPSNCTKGAVVNQPPSWQQTITSNTTGPSRPYGLAIDPSSTELSTTWWVAESTGSLQKFKDNTSSWTGGVSRNPDRPVIIQGGKTQLVEPHGIAIEPKTGHIWVTNPNQKNDTAVPSFPAGSVTEYSPTQSGNSAPISRLIGANTKLDDPSGVGFDREGNLWVANPEFEAQSDVEGDAVRKYLTGTQPTPTPTVTPTPTPTVTPTPAPAAPSPYLHVGARSKNKRLKLEKRQRIVHWENTDGTLTKMRTRCFLNKKRLTGKAKRRICDIDTVNKQPNRGSAGSKKVFVTPSCIAGLTFKSKVVADFPNIPGAEPEKWKRSWTAKNPRSTLRGDVTRCRP